MLKATRKQNPVLFDLVLFIAFTAAAFAAYFLAQEIEATGGMIAVTLLALVCLALIFSR